MTFMIQNKKHYAYRLSEAIWEEVNQVKKERLPKNEMRRLAETYGIGGGKIEPTMILL